MKRKKENKIVLIIGFILIIISVFIFTFDIYKNTKKEVQEVKMVDDFFIEEEYSEEVIPQEQLKEEDNKKSSSPSYNYIAILEIPSIDLKRGIVDYNSRYNNRQPYDRSAQSAGLFYRALPSWISKMSQ